MSVPLTAATVHAALREHVLVDGYEIVPDLAKSRDSYLADARDGRRYLDFFNFGGSQPLGYNHSRLAEASFLHRLGRAAVHKPSNRDIATLEYGEFVRTFGRVGIPETLPHLSLISSDDLAVENALKAAFHWKAAKNRAKDLPEATGRQVLHFRHAFHGRSGYTLSLSDTEAATTRCFPTFDWPRMASPFARFPLEGANLRDTEDREIEAIAEVRTAFRRQPDAIAAVVIEPIQCEGGDNHFRAEFLQELRKACDEFEALLVFDEVEVGAGTTGTFWCHEGLGVVPDVLAFGKKMQVCGILAGPRLDEVEDNVFAASSRIGSTWGGNLVDMVRATRILEIVESDDLLSNAKTTGEALLKGLAEIASADERVTNVRGRGVLAAFDVPSTAHRERLIASARDRGLLSFACGERSVRLRPSLCVKRAEIDHALEILRACVKDLDAKT